MNDFTIGGCYKTKDILSECAEQRVDIVAGNWANQSLRVSIQIDFFHLSLIFAYSNNKESRMEMLKMKVKVENDVPISASYEAVNELLKREVQEHFGISMNKRWQVLSIFPSIKFDDFIHEQLE